MQRVLCAAENNRCAGLLINPMSSIRRNAVLRETAHILVPLILMYALYVQFHGEYGAGGGFQAGVIFAAGMVIYGLIHGRTRLQQVVPLRAAEILACVGVLLYGGTGLAAMLMGGEFLDYSVFADDQRTGQHAGIWLVELGISATVAGTAIIVFHLFSGAGKSRG